MQTVFFIQDVYNITGIGAIPVGNIKSGKLIVGMTVTINGKAMTLKSIEKNHTQFKEAHAGDNVGITLSDADYKTLKAVSRSDIIFVGDDNMMVNEQKPEPIHPKGIFDSIKSLFRKN